MFDDQFKTAYRFNNKLFQTQWFKNKTSSLQLYMLRTYHKAKKIRFDPASLIK